MGFQRTRDLPATEHLSGARAPVSVTRTKALKFQELSGQTQFWKSATRFHTSWTAMATIRKPKILLIAPTALGPRRLTSGPPRTKNRVTLSATAAIPMIIPRYAAALST